MDSFYAYLFVVLFMADVPLFSVWDENYLMV